MTGDTVEVLTTDEAAKLLRCSPTYVAQLCKSKRLPATNLGGPLGWRITRHAIDAFLAGQAPRRASGSSRRQAR